MLFSHDLEMCVEDQETLQANSEQWQHSYEQAGLKVNISNTEAMITEGGGFTTKDITDRELKRMKI